MVAEAHKDIEKDIFMNESSKIELENMKKEKDAAVELSVKERDKAAVDAAQMERELRTILEQTIEKDLYTLTTWTGSLCPCACQAVAFPVALRGSAGPTRLLGMDTR